VVRGRIANGYKLFSRLGHGIFCIGDSLAIAGYLAMFFIGGLSVFYSGIEVLCGVGV
jgi:hypothetical protein